MAKLALYAASNYVGTPNQLHGCVNDVVNVRARAERAGFVTTAMLLNGDMSTVAWKSALLALAACARPGDVVLHMHSHHGSQIQDIHDADGLAEVWCPNDFDFTPERMIEDNWMSQLIASLQPGVLWVDWADCCHAGDSLRTLWCKGERPRYIPNPALENCKSAYLSRPLIVASDDRKGVLLAACHSDQTSADTIINDEPQGAFTGIMLQSGALQDPVSYRELLTAAALSLALSGYNQTPELDCATGDDQLVSFAEPTAEWIGGAK